MVMFWVTLLSVSILLYVLLDGFDLGVGMLLGLTSSETRRRDILAAVAPIWDGNETWLVVTAVILWGCLSRRLCDPATRLLSSTSRHAGGADPSRRGV
jgi:hypothetical protein